MIKDFTTQDGIKMKNGRFLFFQKKTAFSFKPLENILIHKNFKNQKIKKNYNTVDFKYKAGLFEINKELQKLFEKKK